MSDNLNTETQIDFKNEIKQNIKNPLKAISTKPVKPFFPQKRFIFTEKVSTIKPTPISETPIKVMKSQSNISNLSETNLEEHTKLSTDDNKKKRKNSAIDYSPIDTILKDIKSIKNVQKKMKNKQDILYKIIREEYGYNTESNDSLSSV